MKLKKTFNKEVFVPYDLKILIETKREHDTLMAVLNGIFTEDTEATTFDVECMKDDIKNSLDLNVEV